MSMQQQGPFAGKSSRKNRNFPQKSLIAIGIVLALISISLIVLWIENRLGNIPNPWSGILSSILGTTYGVIGALFGAALAIVIAVIAALNKDLFQWFLKRFESPKTDEHNSRDSLYPIGNVLITQKQASNTLSSKLDMSPELSFPQNTIHSSKKTTSSLTLRIPESIFHYNVLHLPVVDELYGRERDRVTLVRRTKNGDSTSVIGSRRIGKTWLIDYLKLVAPFTYGLGPDCRIGYLDASQSSCETLSG